MAFVNENEFPVEISADSFANYLYMPLKALLESD